MARVPHIVRKRKKSKIMGSPEVISRHDIEAMQVDARLDLIRSLIPLGLSFVMEELDREVVSLAERSTVEKQATTFLGATAPTPDQ